MRWRGKIGGRERARRGARHSGRKDARKREDEGTRVCKRVRGGEGNGRGGRVASRRDAQGEREVP